MKLTHGVVYVGSLVFSVLLVVWLHSNERNQSPRYQDADNKLFINPVRLDFGKIRPWDAPEKKLLLRNNTNQPITISGVAVTCSCIKASLDPTTLNPGDELLLSVKLTLDKYRSDNVKGEVYVRYGDHKMRPAHPIPVTARIIPEYTITPNDIDFGLVRHMDASENQLLFTTDAGVSITSLNITGPFTAETTEAQEQDPPTQNNIIPSASTTLPPSKVKQSFILLRLMPDAPLGILHGSITIHTDCARKPEAKVTLRAERRGVDCVIKPKVLVFGPVPPGIEIPPLTVSGSQAFTLDNIESDPPGIELAPDFSSTAPSSAENTQLVIPLRLTSDVQSGDLAGVIRAIIRQNGLESVVSIRFFGTVAPQ